MRKTLARINVSLTANDALERMLKAVNDGFNGGEIEKNDLASWIILHCDSHCFKNSVEKIRVQYFDQVAYLDSIVQEARKARKNGQTPDLQPLLAPIVSSSRTRESKKTKLDNTIKAGPSAAV